MAYVESRREHSNLYYILEADKQANPMPSEWVERLREKIFKNYLRIDNTNLSAEAVAKMIKEKFKSAEIQIRSVGGLCGFYAERGGVLIGYES